MSKKPKKPKVSVSLRSIIHSYWEYDFNYNDLIKEFPSPYGVSFILIGRRETVEVTLYLEFPSPYGVSFILIVLYEAIQNLPHCCGQVSVSLRSIIHSYSCNNVK